MSSISHKQALQLINRRMDGLLNDSQRLLVEEHLRSCDSCFDYAKKTERLSTHLQNEFHHRWDARSGPSRNVSEQVMAKTKNIPMTNRISAGVKLMAGAMALIILGVTINFVVSRLQNTAPAANATQSVINAPLPEERLLAFASDQNGNLDIYTMHADGTGLTNLTNDPANDTNPIWSPDGKHIAFESDRDGFVQIYLMDAHGSDIIQLTNDKAAHKLPLNRNGTHNPWSPDGSRLLFLQEEAGKDMKTLYSIDTNGENKIRLAHGRISSYDVSWSPGGQHIAFLLDISPTPDKYMPDLYVVEPDGSNVRELKKLLPAEKQPDFIYSYYWSSNGQSIFLPASATGSLREAIYQLDLQTNTFLNETETKLIVTDWSEGVSLIKDINQEGMPYVWERSDGTSNTFEASKAWDTTYDPSIASAAPCSLDFTRSTQNNFAFGVYCPDSKFNLYWTNADGSIIKQLLTLPTDVDAGGVGEIAWSPDDQYMAFNITSADKTEMYVVNVEEFLASSSNQPLHVSVSNGKGTGIPSWQPVINEDLTKELPTPQPTLTSSLGGLLAFTSDQSGNLDIYTMGADGSGLTNLTNNPAWDSNPTWSPDGKRIAFESDRDGFTQIYWMNADGSDVVQLTHNQASHFLPMNIHSESYPWSPDGSKLLFLQQESGADASTLYSLDMNSGDTTKLATGQVQFNNISWSPDGKHIGYVLNDSPTPESTFVIGIYVVDPTGDNLVAIKDFVPQTDKLDSPAYYWSKDGNSIIFTAYRHLNEGSDQWIAYEYVLDSQQLIERATSSTRMEDWWEGTSFIGGNMSTLTWLRSDGTSNTFKPIEACQATGDGPYGFMMRRSPNGSQVINIYCPNAEMWFYYANSDGTIIKPLLNFPIPFFTADNSVTNMTWSSDDEFIAVTLVAPKKSSLYILNVKEPAAQPKEIVISNAELYEAPSWQPTP